MLGLACSRNLLAGEGETYEGETDVVRLASAYGVGLVRNHLFADGMFLALNSWRLTAPQADAVLTMFALAAGDLDEQFFIGWLREHVRPRRQRRPGREPRPRISRDPRLALSVPPL